MLVSGRDLKQILFRCKRGNTQSFLGFPNSLVDIPPIRVAICNTVTSISEGHALSHFWTGFAAGLPCVSTDVGSLQRVDRGGSYPDDRALGRSGFVCEIANVQQLADGYMKTIQLMQTLERGSEMWQIKSGNIGFLYSRYHSLDTTTRRMYMRIPFNNRIENMEEQLNIVQGLDFS